jgi:hypothetical protein
MRRTSGEQASSSTQVIAEAPSCAASGSDAGERPGWVGLADAYRALPADREENEGDDEPRQEAVFFLVLTCSVAADVVAR